MVVLAPASVQEMADLTVLAFDLADKYRNPVMVAADGNLGQMMEPVELKESYPNTHDHSAWALTGAKGRKGHTITSIYLEADEMEDYIHKLYRKYDAIEKDETRFEEYLDERRRGRHRRVRDRVARGAVGGRASCGEEGIKAGHGAADHAVAVSRRPCCASWPTRRSSSWPARCRWGRWSRTSSSPSRAVKPVYFYGRQGGNVPTPAEVVAAVKQRM